MVDQVFFDAAPFAKHHAAAFLAWRKREKKTKPRKERQPVRARSQDEIDAAFLVKLQVAFGDKPITTKSLTERMGFSKSMSYRLLKHMAESGFLRCEIGVPNKYGQAPNIYFIEEADSATAT